MSNLHQKKFYSSEETDRVIEQHAQDKGYGYSKAMRHIILSWAGELVSIPKVKSDNPEYLEYLAGVLDPRD